MAGWLTAYVALAKDPVSVLHTHVINRDDGFVHSDNRDEGKMRSTLIRVVVGCRNSKLSC